MKASHRHIKAIQITVMMFHSSLFTVIYKLLVANVGFPLVSAAEITVEDIYRKINPTAALPGFNVEGGSVFTNLVKTLNEGQLFFIRSGTTVVERPESDPIRWFVLDWCSDLTFSDVHNSSLIGYVGRCVEMFMAGYDDIVASGAQVPYYFSKGKFISTTSISAVFVEQLNVFEGQLHVDTDDIIWRYWDDGRNVMPMIGWEGHDEGDMNPNAATSSVSQFGDVTWMSVDEVAQLLNKTVDEFTPETFKQVYVNTWIKDHEDEAATSNPNPGPELEIVEQVRNETNSADDTTAAAAQPDSNAAEDGNSSVAYNSVEDDSGSGRQLMSFAARFASTALRVFGI